MYVCSKTIALLKCYGKTHKIKITPSITFVVLRTTIFITAKIIRSSRQIFWRQSIYVSATISLVTRYHKISGKAFIQTTLQEIL